MKNNVIDIPPCVIVMMEQMVAKNKTLPAIFQPYNLKELSLKAPCLTAAGGANGTQAQQ